MWRCCVWRGMNKNTCGHVQGARPPHVSSTRSNVNSRTIHVQGTSQREQPHATRKFSSPIHIFPFKFNHKSVCRSAGGPCRTRAERNDIYATSVQYSYCHVKVKEDLISILHKMEELRPHFYPTFVISCLQVRKIRPSICRSL